MSKFFALMAALGLFASPAMATDAASVDTSTDQMVIANADEGDDSMEEYVPEDDFVDEEEYDDGM